MQYADPESAAHPYSEDLVAPEPLVMNLPEGLRPTRVVFVGILDQTGVLRHMKVLEPGEEWAFAVGMIKVKHEHLIGLGVKLAPKSNVSQ